jgi:hypothetical protein
MHPTAAGLALAPNRVHVHGRQQQSSGDRRQSRDHFAGLRVELNQALTNLVHAF